MNPSSGTIKSLKNLGRDMLVLIRDFMMRIKSVQSPLNLQTFPYKPNLEPGTQNFKAGTLQSYFI